MVDLSVPNKRAIMINEAVDSYPKFPLADGFIIKGYEDGFENDWADIEVEQQGLEKSRALEVFKKEFLSRPELIRSRCLFVIEEKTGKVASIASLWRGELVPGMEMNRVHWVATRDEFQGLGLSKALLSYIMDLYHELGETDGIYLTTQSASYVAINIYKKFGFTPYLGEYHKAGEFDLAAHREAWEIIDRKISEYKRKKA